ncbi:hypothetical protein E2C01_076256 [Portunus trituberculatus]|uniref:Uncharacterized protein n=1 Tax=Portunus trituberculatus TaxID=210409 RepID=A0A5B7ILJ7_PORTR|nr:hypothetical protein [Portunus trituberculatus]
MLLLHFSSLQRSCLHYFLVTSLSLCRWFEESFNFNDDEVARQSRSAELREKLGNHYGLIGKTSCTMSVLSGFDSQRVMSLPPS